MGESGEIRRNPVISWQAQQRVLAFFVIPTYLVLPSVPYLLRHPHLHRPRRRKTYFYVKYYVSSTSNSPKFSHLKSLLKPVFWSADGDLVLHIGCWHWHTYRTENKPTYIIHGEFFWSNCRFTRSYKQRTVRYLSLCCGVGCSCLETVEALDHLMFVE